MRLIDADALINHVVKKYGKTEKDYLLFFLADVIFDIDEQPTIEAEPVRHGKWIYKPKDAIEMMYTKPKCSVCGYESADGLHYCPNCGAKMDLEE